MQSNLAATVTTTHLQPPVWMDSSTHHSSQQRPQSLHSYGESRSFTNGLHPHATVGSFDTSVSAASGTLAHSPPPKGHHREMSFTMGSQGSQNGTGLQHSGYRSFGDANGHMQQHPQPGHPPQIYTVRIFLPSNPSRLSSQ